MKVHLEYIDCEFVNNCIFYHIVTKPDDDVVEVCSTNKVSTFDLRTKVCTASEEDERFGGYILNMERHRLLDLVSNYNNDVRVLLGKQFVYQLLNQSRQATVNRQRQEGSLDADFGRPAVHGHA